MPHKAKNSFIIIKHASVCLAKSAIYLNMWYVYTHIYMLKIGQLWARALLLETEFTVNQNSVFI